MAHVDSLRPLERPKAPPSDARVEELLTELGLHGAALLVCRAVAAMEGSCTIELRLPPRPGQKRGPKLVYHQEARRPPAAPAPPAPPSEPEPDDSGPF